tara:strand:- start:743 stop:901 length:159 start_codon:yes stop_codon:yes gene_type:complete
MTKVLARIPVNVVTHPHPALIGAFLTIAAGLRTKMASVRKLGTTPTLPIPIP